MKKKKPIRLHDVAKQDRQAAQEMIQKMLARERHILADKIIDEIYLAFLVSVYDTFDCDAHKLKECADKALFQFDCVSAGVIDIGDFAGLLKEELNFEISDKHEVKKLIPNFGNIKKLDTLLAKIDCLLKEC